MRGYLLWRSFHARVVYTVTRRHFRRRLVDQVRKVELLACLVDNVGFVFRPAWVGVPDWFPASLARRPRWRSAAQPRPNPPARLGDEAAIQVRRVRKILLRTGFDVASSCVRRARCRGCRLRRRMPCGHVRALHSHAFRIQTRISTRAAAGIALPIHFPDAHTFSRFRSRRSKY